MYNKTISKNDGLISKQIVLAQAYRKIRQKTKERPIVTIFFANKRVAVNDWNKCERFRK